MGKAKKSPEKHTQFPNTHTNAITHDAYTVVHTYVCTLKQYIQFRQYTHAQYIMRICTAFKYGLQTHDILPKNIFFGTQNLSTVCP